jgi:cytochrome c oxidase subunit II
MRWIRLVLYLPPGGSTFADGIDLLHLFVIGTTMLAATGIAALTLYYMLRYRHRSPEQTTKSIRGSTIGEIGIIGSVLAVFLLFWAIGFRQYVYLETPPEGAMVIHVTAKQWMWKFSYPSERRTINVLTVPLARPVKLLMTSRDVIHSFYVPGFRIKQDVLPGRYVTAWFEATAPGSYDIYCAEYCGTSHSRMIGTVRVLTQPEYDSWLAREDEGEVADTDKADGAGEPSADPVRQGREIAQRRQCFACHTVDGQRHLGPTWRKLYRARIPLEDGSVVVADEAFLTRSMMEPLAEVHAGFKPVMPSYQGVLAAPEVAALVEFIKSLREGDVESGVELPTSTDAAGVPTVDRPERLGDPESRRLKGGSR